MCMHTAVHAHSCACPLTHTSMHACARTHAWTHTHSTNCTSWAVSEHQYRLSNIHHLHTCIHVKSSYAENKNQQDTTTAISPVSNKFKYGLTGALTESLADAHLHSLLTSVVVMHNIISSTPSSSMGFMQTCFWTKQNLWSQTEDWCSCSWLASLVFMPQGHWGKMKWKEPKR